MAVVFSAWLGTSPRQARTILRLIIHMACIIMFLIWVTLPLLLGIAPPPWLLIPVAVVGANRSRLICDWESDFRKESENNPSP